MLSNGEDTILAAAIHVTGVAAVFSFGICHARLFMYTKVATHIALDRESTPASLIWALVG
jgi:hypothetical protein